MTHERVQELFKEAERILIACRDGINKGEMVDVSQFEPVIKDLCQTLATMDRGDAREYEIHLQAMNDALQAISTVLKQKRDEMKRQMTQLNDQQKGNKAYAAARAADVVPIKPNKDNE